MQKCLSYYIYFEYSIAITGEAVWSVHTHNIQYLYWASGCILTPRPIVRKTVWEQLSIPLVMHVHTHSCISQILNMHRHKHQEEVQDGLSSFKQNFWVTLPMDWTFSCRSACSCTLVFLYSTQLQRERGVDWSWYCAFVHTRKLLWLCARFKLNESYYLMCCTITLRG